MMGVKAQSRASSDIENWDKIFKALVKVLRTKQDQLESLVNERKILEDRIKMQFERWVSDVRIYEEHLSQMKSKVETVEIMRSVDTAKWDLLVGLKDRDAFVCNLKLEYAEDDLDDFKNWFHLLTEIPNGISPKASRNTCENNVKAADHKTLENEIRRLKLEYEKIALEKRSDVSALLRENGFAWFQFKRMESELTDKLKIKDDEMVQANEKISVLVSCKEQLQASNQEKDETILRLKVKVAQMEDDSNKKDEEISRLSRELDSLKKSRSSSITPILRRCSRGKKGNTGANNVVPKKEPSSAVIPVPLKGSKSSKRQKVKDNSVSEPPKLFTSSFRVPKLKIPSPQVIRLS